MVVPPWGKILVPIQGTHITVSLGPSTGRGPPPRWEMKDEHKDSWSTSLLPHYTLQPSPQICLPFLGPVTSILLGFLFDPCPFHLRQDPTVSA